MKIRLILFLTVIGISLNACKYNKLLRSTNVIEKYTAAVEFYDSSKCYKALPLLDELIGLVRGDTLYEDVYYYYAKTNYCIGDYYLANYYCKNFASTFSTSPRAEELLFLSAMSSYQNSPNYSLDQQDTEAALNEFQYFLDNYPNSELKDSCNNMMGRLNYKLEKKAYEVANLYVKTEKYKSGTIAVAQVLSEYPDSQFREDLYALRVETWFKYAEGSIENKKVERYDMCIKHYLTFVANFPESAYGVRSESFYKRAYDELKRLKGEAPEERAEE